MNNEIKEINIKIPGQILDYVDTKDHLLDLFNYITNLQQENHELKSKLECYENGAYYSSKVDELEQENERLKKLCKEWKENHKAICIQRDNILDNIVKDTEKRIDYKSRCEKAIEYIESTTFFGLRSGKTFMSKYLNDLLNTLQNGSDK